MKTVAIAGVRTILPLFDLICHRFFFEKINQTCHRFMRHFFDK
jgi:hypothetical protein